MSKAAAVLVALFASAGLVAVSAQAAPLSPIPASPIQETDYPFPFPVQWLVAGVQISVTGVAWGPANSPEMISRSSAPVTTRWDGRGIPEKPSYLPGTYALAIRLQGTAPMVEPGLSVGSGLVLVRDVNGDYQIPMHLTPEGFVAPTGVFGRADLSFLGSSSRTIEAWDIFPVSPEQKAFLFQRTVGRYQPNPEQSDTSFRVLIEKSGIRLVPIMQPEQYACGDFSRDFTGTIGSNIAFRVQLTGKNKNLSGTEEYARTGKTLWLVGKMDTFGNILLHEEYPQGHVTGIFTGQLSASCKQVSGYFSKPDGSELLPFELH